MGNRLDTESRSPGSNGPSGDRGHYAVCLGDSHTASFDQGVGEARGGGRGKFYDELESHPEARLVQILALALCYRHQDKLRW